MTTEARNRTNTLERTLSGIKSSTVERSLDWIRNNVIPNGGIAVSSRERESYPEVTGYLIPTLYNYGEVELARSFTRWLVSIQLPTGAFPSPGSQTGFAFDTGQVIRGLVRAAGDVPGAQESLVRACRWMMDSSSEGRLPLPQIPAAWSLGPRGYISEGVHLYALAGFKLAADALDDPAMKAFVKKSLDYYLANVDLTDFRSPNMLTHLFCYIQEALVDLGATDVAAKGMKCLEGYLRPDGSVPAYSNVDWVCSPGQIQAAMTWYKLGDPNKAERALRFIENLMTENGGFLGSYGPGAEYFADAELSWATKFYLDAVRLIRDSKPAPTESTHEGGNLDPEHWHDAITGGASVETIARSIRSGAAKPWLQVMFEMTSTGHKVLELGSGTGELSAQLALQGRECTLLDFSTQCLEFSCRLFDNLGINGRFVEGDVLGRLPFNDREFNCVWSSGLLEHFSEDQIEHILAESRRVCRGTVVSLVPNAKSVPYRLGKFIQEQSGTWPWGEENPKTTLRPIFERAGFKDISEFTIAPKHSIEFLRMRGMEPVCAAIEAWYDSMSPSELEALDQGYLLVSVGRATRPRRLAVVPNDPLDDYVRAGYPDLTAYFNPGGYFDEVYCLSPWEKQERTMYGMKVVPATVESFPSLVSKYEIDVIRAYDLIAGSFACTNKPQGVPMIVSVHDVNPNRVPRENPDADVFLAISKAVEEFMVERGAPKSMIRTFANRVDMDIFKPIEDKNLRKSFEAKYPGKHRIVHVGRKCEQKNLETVIGAMRVLGPDYVTIFVGAGDKAPYQKLASDLGVAEQCHWVDSVPNGELAQYYSFADCMCTPSRWEGFGIVFIEALASAGVIVTSDVAPMNEYITNDKNGVLVKDFENPEALAEAIKRSCTDESLRATIKGSARQSAEPFSKDNVDRMEIDVYREFVEKDTPKPAPVEPQQAQPEMPAVIQQQSKGIQIAPLTMDIRPLWNSVALCSPDAWMYHMFEEQVLIEEVWGRDSFSFIVHDGENILAICPMQRYPGSGLIDSTTMGPGGPAMVPGLDAEARDQVMNAITAHLRGIIQAGEAKQIRFFMPPLCETALSMDASEPNPLIKYGFVDISTKTSIISLDHTEEELFHGFTKGHASAVKKAEKQGAEIYWATGIEDIRDYYKLHVETYNRTGVTPHPFEYFAKIWEYFGSAGICRIFMAKLDGEPIAATNIARFRNTTLYWTGAYSEKALKLEIGKQLQWEAIKWSRSVGCKFHEVGEVFPDAAKTDKLAGLTTYKRGFGGQIRPFYKGVLV